MSALYGQVTGDSGTRSTRASQRTITAWVQTEYGRVTVYLDAEGSYVVEESPVVGHERCGPSQEIARGNVGGHPFRPKRASRRSSHHESTEPVQQQFT